MGRRKYKLRILPLFEQDLNEIVDYIAFHLKSPQAAEDFVEEVEKAIQKRLDSAEAFAPYPYVVIDNVMEVRRVLYQKRNLEKEL